MPLDAKALADKFVRSELVRAGKLHTVEVIISAKKQPVSVSIRHNAFKTPYSGGSSEDVFTPEIFDAKTVAGRVFRESPGESFGRYCFYLRCAFPCQHKIRSGEIGRGQHTLSIYPDGPTLYTIHVTR